MKLQFEVKTLTGQTVSLSLSVACDDTVKAIKERIVSVEPNPFPDQVLLLNGQKLHDDAKVSECGLEDGACLSFETYASEEALARQFQGMLHANGSLAVDELGLMYSFKHGVTVGQALQALGKNELPKDFLMRMGKHFIMDGDNVKAVPAEVAVKSVAVDAVQLLKITVLVTLQLPFMIQEAVEHTFSVRGGDIARCVKERVSVPVPLEGQVLLLQGKPISDKSRLKDVGVMDGACMQLIAVASEATLAEQLAALLVARGPMSRVEIEDAFCLRQGVSASQVLRLLGWGERLQSFFERHSRFTVQRGCISLAPTFPTAPTYRPEENDAYVALHSKLCGDNFMECVEKSLDGLASLFANDTLLNISHVVKGGAAANGTAIPGAAGAELVLFVEGLPPTGQDVWLPGLAASVSSGIGQRLIGQEGIQEVRAEGSKLLISTDGPLGDVNVFFSPAYSDYTDALAALCKQGPEACAVGASAFAEQHARFVRRQPDGVKAAMRLVKWWRQQQQWISEATRPNDELLELVVAHVVAKRTPRDLHEAVDAAISALGKFEDLHVVWPLAARSYREKDIPPSMLEQRPLVMGPANPFANAADRAHFQSYELVERAKSGKFF